MSPDTIEAVRCALQTVCETGGTMDELALIEQADRIAELERQLAELIGGEHHQWTLALVEAAPMAAIRAIIARDATIAKLHKEQDDG